jgi:PAS domain S-box-containing protein
MFTPELIAFFEGLGASIGISLARKRAEERLSESEARHRHTLDNMIEGCQTIGFDWRYLYLNDSAARQGHRPKEELLGRTMMEAYPGIEATEMFAVLRRCMEQRTVQSMENEFRYPDGGTASFELTVQPVPEGIFILSVDITDRKRAEGKLQESEARYRALFERAPYGVLTIDLATATPIEFNDQAARQLGYSREEFARVHIPDYEAAETVEQTAEHIRKVLAEGRDDFETKHRTKRGELRDVLVSAQRLDLAGRTSVLAIYQDITDRKRAEDSLQESEARYRGLFEHAAEGILVADLETRRFRYANPAICSMLRYTEEELTQLSVADIHPKEALEHVIAEFEAQARGEKELAPGIPCLRKDGTVVYADICTAGTEIGGRRCNVGFFADATERRVAERERERLNAELAAKNRELEQLLYVATHDLRTPLVNVQGFSQELNHSVSELVALLAPKKLPDALGGKLWPIVVDDIPESIHYIQNGIARMDALLKGLLRISRLGRAALTMEQLDMNELLSQVTQALRFTTEQKGARIEVGPVPCCRGDRSQIGQLFTNIIDNALKYLAPGRPGRVTVRGSIEDGKAAYCVEDNGIGIATDYVGSVFEIFNRLDPRATQGEGLGLTIARRITERHGGRIWIESQQGKGTTVHVQLPAA